MINLSSAKTALETLQGYMEIINKMNRSKKLNIGMYQTHFLASLNQVSANFWSILNQFCPDFFHFQATFEPK